LTRRSSNANSLCGGGFGWITGNLCDLSKGYFATTFLSSSLTCPATQSRLCGSCAEAGEILALGLSLRNAALQTRIVSVANIPTEDDLPCCFVLG
jgi:hypothetical protein